MTMRFALAALVALAGGLVSAAARADDAVDLALVLAIDSSSSVSADEFYLQTEGLAVAFADPEVQAAIGKGAHGAIAVAVMEWSDPGRQEVDVPWIVVTPANVGALATRFGDLPRLVDGGGTALGAGIAAAAALFENAPPAARRVIDVSGDGRTSAGPVSAPARDAAVAQGIVVNGLAIINEEPDLVEFYRDNVIGGPGAFVIRAKDYEDFTEAVRAKLLREIEAPPLVSEGPRPGSGARRHAQSGAIDPDDHDPSAGRKVGPGDGPARVADAHAPRSIDDRLDQRGHGALE
jgi:hypothetical protein